MSPSETIEATRLAFEILLALHRGELAHNTAKDLLKNLGFEVNFT